MSHLTLSLVQTHLYWEDTEANLRHFSEKIKGLPKTDLIILPEMFNTGFTMVPYDLALPADANPVIDWMKAEAAQTSAAICGSMIVEKDSHYYNRLYFIEPDGKVSTYDKRHLFRMAGEDESYTAGKNNTVVNYKGWRIKLQICYDLRFPVWSRSINSCDLMVFVANWPAPRASAWQSLVVARAIENQCYVAGVNRIETDGNQVPYQGNSRLIDPKGDILKDLEDADTVYTSSINKKELEALREKFPVHLDADDFEINL